ncbi:hypothetical protein B0H17DRAFT_1079501 [Mycena rosella]|uniref:Uncharacterized protein n=1 Tax=Mycena rosella TaxID=1033263 RepID=A0AAD7GCS5_MYCRO|nr:hypothetical protein B0H17DRAFT_1079501 [Mycena rosella]
MVSSRQQEWYVSFRSHVSILTQATPPCRNRPCARPPRRPGGGEGAFHPWSGEDQHGKKGGSAPGEFRPQLTVVRRGEPRD